MNDSLKDTQRVAHFELCHGDHPSYPLFKGDAWTVWYVCSECKKAIDVRDNYCKHCGVKLSQFEGIENTPDCDDGYWVPQ